MAFPTVVGLSYGMEKDVHTDSNNRTPRTIGTRGVTPDGRVFYWAQNGSVALVPHTTVSQRVNGEVGDHDANITVATDIGGWDATAASPGIQAGQTSVGIVWNTAHTRDFYTDGYLTIETTPGEGVYRIAQDVSGGDSATNTVIILEEDDAIKVALTTVSKVSLYANPYKEVLVAAAANSLLSRIAGVVPVTVAAGSSNFFWLQTWGQAAIRYGDGNPAITAGLAVMPSQTSGGEARGMINSTVTTTAILEGTATAAAITVAKPVLGYALSGISDTNDNITVFLTISQ